jgi:hypothetical protein
MTTDAGVPSTEPGLGTEGAGATPAPAGTQAGATPADAGPSDGASGATPPPEDKQLEAALRRERDARKAAEAELRKLKPQAVDAEALAARIAELEAAAALATREALVARIVTELALPPALGSRLVGTDEAELRADAEALRAAIPAAVTPQASTQSVGGPQGPPAGARSPEEWLQVLRKR